MSKPSLLAEHLTSDLYTFMSDGHGLQLFEEPHREMCEFAESLLPPPPDKMHDADQKKGLLLEPRETLKTTIAAQGLAEYFLLKWKVRYGYDGRVAIVRSAREAACNVVTAVSLDLSNSNPVLQRAFGDLSKDAPKWKNEYITLNWRETVYREPSVMAGAPGMSLTGNHFDLIIVDDIVNETNYTSEAEMTKARVYIQTMLPILNAWGSILVIGTRWGYNDPYGWIIEMDAALEESGKKPQWQKLIKGAYNEDGSLLYPAFLTEKRLQNKRESLEEKLFTSQYLNVVTVESSKVFQEAWLVGQYYDGVYTPDRDEIATLKVFEGTKFEGSEFPVAALLVIDPAATATATSNFTAMALGLSDEYGNFWIHDSFKGKLVPSDVRSKIIELVGHYDIPDLSIDTLGQQVLWVDEIQSDLRKAGLKCTVHLHKGKKLYDGKIQKGMHTKASRIESMQPLFKYGKIFLRKGHCSPIVNEYRFYDGPTHKNHFDMLDAMAQIPIFAKKPNAKTYRDRLEEIEEAMEFEEAGVEMAPRRRNWAGR